MHSYGHGWSGPQGTATAERKPYRGPGRTAPVTSDRVEQVRGWRYPMPSSATVSQDSVPMVRTPDHDTSIEGAQKAVESRENIQGKLLAVWHAAGAKGFTDEEAAEAAELTHTTYWKRAGELRAKGLIVYNGEKRKGRSGVGRKVSVFVTEESS